MVSKTIVFLGIVMLLAGIGIGYMAAALSGTETSPEDQARDEAIQGFRTFLTCIPPSHDEAEVTPDTSVHYNFDEDGNLMMIEIETTQSQTSSAWGHLPDGHPGMEFEHWALHVWFQDPEEACPDLEDLVDDLREEGVMVEETGEIEQPFFSVKGRVFWVDGDTLQVYVYEDFHVATNEGARVSADGYTVKTEQGESNIQWVAPPHFYQVGKMIVVYLGSDPYLKGVLGEVAGYQFAGAP